MSCKAYNNLFDLYVNQTISDNDKIMFEAHIENCQQCRNSLIRLIAFEQFVKSEQQIVSNPYLTTRIISTIENLKVKQNIATQWKYSKLLKPVIITLGIFTAIFIGNHIGKIYQLYQNSTMVSTYDDIYITDDFDMEAIYYLVND